MRRRWLAILLAVSLTASSIMAEGLTVAAAGDSAEEQQENSDENIPVEKTAFSEETEISEQTEIEEETETSEEKVSEQTEPSEETDSPKEEEVPENTEPSEETETSEEKTPEEIEEAEPPKKEEVPENTEAEEETEASEEKTPEQTEEAEPPKKEEIPENTQTEEKTETSEETEISEEETDSPKEEGTSENTKIEETKTPEAETPKKTETSEETEIPQKAETSKERETKKKEEIPETEKASDKEEIAEQTENTAKGETSEETPQLQLPVGLPETEIITVDEVQDEMKFSITDREEAEYFSQIYASEWDKYSTNYYYNQMDSKKQEIWDALDLMCRNYLLGSGNAEWNEGVYLTKFVKIPEMSQAEVIELARIFRFSNPQYYFLMPRYFGMMDGMGNYYVAFGVYSAFGDGAARKRETAKFKQSVGNLLAESASSADKAERVRRIHDTVVNNVEYNYDFLIGIVDEDRAYSQSAYSVFCTDLTVCAGYSMAFEMLCNAIGVDCITVTSNDHQWNKTRINDSWYNVDCTWADQSSYVYYQYFERNDRFYDWDNPQQASSHTEEYFWEKYLPVCSLDTNPSSLAPGVLPAISQTTKAPDISITKKGSAYQVVMKSATEGADIYYTLNGEKPAAASTRSKKYKGAFTTEKVGPVRAVAVHDAYWDSAVRTKYTITYHLNGGKNNSGNPGSYYTSAAVSLKNPTRTGYTFVGWYTNASCTNRITVIKKGSTGNKTLYAGWKPSTYKVVYRGNGSTSGSMGVTSCKYGTGYKLKANAFKRKGYSFAGWNTKADGSGTSFKDRQVIKNLTSKAGVSVNLYAKWNKIKYGITYSLNGGKNNSKNPTSYYVTSATITLKNPTKPGYTFVGWYQDSAYKKKVTKIVKGSVGNRKLYAAWKPNKNIIIGIPSNVTAKPNSYNTVKISWSAVAKADYYQVYRSESPNGKYVLLGVYDNKTLNSLSRSLRCGTTYYYKVRAYRWKGGKRVFSPFSKAVSAKPVLSAPKNVKAVRLSSSSVKITWKAVPGAEYYQVYRAASKNGKYALLGTYDNKTTGSVSKALTRGKTYYYKVRTYRWAGGKRVFSPYSSITAATPR